MLNMNNYEVTIINMIKIYIKRNYIQNRDLIYNILYILIFQNIYLLIKIHNSSQDNTQSSYRINIKEHFVYINSYRQSNTKYFYPIRTNDLIRAS